MACAPSEEWSAWASTQSDQSSLSEWRKLGSLATYWVHTVGLVMRWLVCESYRNLFWEQWIQFWWYKLDRVKRIWYLSSMRAAKVQASLRIRAVSPEPPLLAHTNSESRGTFRQKARSLASLNGWACAVKTCRDGMLEDTNSLDGAQLTNAVTK